MSLSELPSARDRIVITAYDLFTRRGVNAVGVDEVFERVEVAKTTVYRHFPSKEDLVVAFLDRREELWAVEVIDRGPRERTADPEGQLLAIFDVMDDWFHTRSDYEACSFVKVLLEWEKGDASAKLASPISAESGRCCEGDPDPARRAGSFASWIIDQHR